jgi:hypothetical protein
MESTQQSSEDIQPVSNNRLSFDQYVKQLHIGNS